MIATPGTRFLLLAFALAALGGPALRADDAEGPADEATLVSQYKSSRQGGDWVQLGAVSKQLLALHPKSWVYMRGLAESEFHAGDYAAAAEGYSKAIEAAGVQSSAMAKTACSEMGIDLGDAYLRLKKIDEAIAAYSAAAKGSTDPAAIYFTICEAMYNRGSLDYALQFAGKTIESSPKNAGAYFIKGAVLVRKGSQNRDTGRFEVAAGAKEALQKYLELEPYGSHAEEAKRMLEVLD